MFYEKNNKKSLYRTSVQTIVRTVPNIALYPTPI